MNKLILTLNMVENCLPDSILATGVVLDNPSGINMSNSGEELRWVLKLGYTGDWSVYTSRSTSQSPDTIAKYGQKVHSRDNIENIIEFTDEVWERYRS